MRILTDPGIVDKAVIALAESVASILADQNGDKAVALTKTFEQCSDYLKANVVTDDDPSRTNTIPDDGKLTSRLKEMVAAMVVADPSLKREYALYSLLHSSHGRRLAEHLNSLFKNEKDNPPMTRTEEMFEMRKYVKGTNGGLAAIAKRVISEGSTSLTEHEFTDLWKTEAGSTAAFVKEFEGPRTVKHDAYAIVRDASQVKTYLKSFPNMMRVDPVSTETSSTLVSDDSKKAADQLKALVEEQRAKAPTLTISELYERVYADPANRKLTARAHRRPNASSPSYDSELQR
jgi:hypothetical protein